MPIAPWEYIASTHCRLSSLPAQLQLVSPPKPPKQHGLSSEARLLHEALEAARRQLGEAVDQNVCKLAMYCTALSSKWVLPPFHQPAHTHLRLVLFLQELELQLLRDRHAHESAGLQEALSSKQDALDGMAVQLADALRAGQEVAVDRERLQLQVSEVAQGMQQQVGGPGMHHQAYSTLTPSFVNTKAQGGPEFSLFPPLGPVPD